MLSVQHNIYTFSPLLSITFRLILYLAERALPFLTEVKLADLIKPRAPLCEAEAFSWNLFEFQTVPECVAHFFSEFAVHVVNRVKRDGFEFIRVDFSVFPED